MGYNNEGIDSEWNEGNLKSKRLDDIQQLINFYKQDCCAKTGNKYHYEWLLRNIEALYGEGSAWYNTEEIEEVEKLKKLSNDSLRIMPPHISLKVSTPTGEKKIYIKNQENYDKLMEILYEFEMRIRYLNNIHGLSSKNANYEEGL